MWNWTLSKRWPTEASEALSPYRKRLAANFSVSRSHRESPSSRPGPGAGLPASVERPTAYVPSPAYLGRFGRCLRMTSDAAAEAAAWRYPATAGPVPALAILHRGGHAPASPSSIVPAAVAPAGSEMSDPDAAAYGTAGREPEDHQAARSPSAHTSGGGHGLSARQGPCHRSHSDRQRAGALLVSLRD